MQVLSQCLGNGVIVLVVLESLPNLLLDLLGMGNHWSEAKSIWNCQVLTHLSCFHSPMKIHWIFPLVCCGLVLKMLRNLLVGCAC